MHGNWVRAVGGYGICAWDDTLLFHPQPFPWGELRQWAWQPNSGPHLPPFRGASEPQETTLPTAHAADSPRQGWAQSGGSAPSRSQLPPSRVGRLARTGAGSWGDEFLPFPSGSRSCGSSFGRVDRKMVNFFLSSLEWKSYSGCVWKLENHQILPCPVLDCGRSIRGVRGAVMAAAPTAHLHTASQPWWIRGAQGWQPVGGAPSSPCSAEQRCSPGNVVMSLSGCETPHPCQGPGLIGSYCGENCITGYSQNQPAIREA